MAADLKGQGRAPATVNVSTYPRRVPSGRFAGCKVVKVKDGRYLGGSSC